MRTGSSTTSKGQRDWRSFGSWNHDGHVARSDGLSLSGRCVCDDRADRRDPGLDQFSKIGRVMSGVHESGGSEVVGNAGQKLVDTVSEATRSKTPGTKEGKTTGGVADGIQSTLDVAVDVVDLRELLDDELAYWTLFRFVHPLQRKMVAVREERERGRQSIKFALVHGSEKSVCFQVKRRSVSLGLVPCFTEERNDRHVVGAVSSSRVRMLRFYGDGRKLV